MKVTKRELTTATRNLCTLLGSDYIKKSIDKWITKNRKADYMIGYVFITPDLAAVAMLYKENPEIISFILYEPYNNKQYEKAANLDVTSDIKDSAYSILYGLLENNKIKVRKLY